MAETPENLGAAQEAYEASEASMTVAQTEMTTAKEALDADKENEELQGLFTEKETAFKEVETKHTEAKTLLDSFKKGYWPEDWRERYISKLKGEEGEELAEDEKEKMMKRLARYSSPRAAMDAMIAAQNKISSGKYKEPLGENSTPEELADWREENNIPEEATGYEVKLAEGLVVGEEDKSLVENFLKNAHENNYSQEHANAALNWYFQNQERLIEERYKVDTEYRIQVEEELRKEWGSEYQANRALMANYLDTAGEGVAELLVGARLADGTPLANNPGVIQFFVDKAREANPAGALVPGSGTKQMEAIEDEIAALEKRMGTSEWHKDQKAQDRYLKLVAARDNVKEK